MLNLPLKHLEIFVFPSARPFSEDAGSSEVKDQNHVLSPPRISALSFQVASQVLEQHLKAQGEHVPPNILHKIFPL